MLDDFYTRDAANEGFRIDLFDKYGKPSEHYLIIRGAESDEFRLANNDALSQSVLTLSIEDEAERNQALLRDRAKLIASLIKEWSFDEELTLQSATEFLINAPQIQDQIDSAAADRGRFLAGKSSNSERSLSQNSSSTESQKAQASQKSKLSSKSGKQQGKSQKS